MPSHGGHPEHTREIRWTYLHMVEEYARHNGHATLSGSGSTASPAADTHSGIASACATSPS